MNGSDSRGKKKKHSKRSTKNNLVWVSKREQICASWSLETTYDYVPLVFYMSLSRGSPSLSLSAWAQQPKLNHGQRGMCLCIISVTEKWSSQWEAGEGRGPGFCKQTHDNDELGLKPRQQAASSIIHLCNKLINEVNEEEQQQQKSCRWTKRDI